MAEGVPDSAVEDVRTMVDHLSALAVLHTDLHELLESGVISVVPVFELVEVGLDGSGHSLYAHCDYQIILSPQLQSKSPNNLKTPFTIYVYFPTNCIFNVDDF
jgi:hypothetical protein